MIPMTNEKGDEKDSVNIFNLKLSLFSEHFIIRKELYLSLILYVSFKRFLLPFMTFL